VPSDSAIELNHVSKIYRGRVHALHDVSLSVRRGEVFGLLGPNGAGKSTLIKIMMTVVSPTRSTGTILGQPVGHKPTLAKVGYLPENHRFPRYLTGRQTLEFFAALSGVDRPTRRRLTAELLETVGMTGWADKRVGAYSKGMMQRIGLAQALVNDPELVLLDEPTDGVDPVGRRDIRDVLLRLRDQGKTIFINSHLLSELEMVCGRVAILVAGRVARHGALDELTAARQHYEIEVSSTADSAEHLRKILAEFEARSNITVEVQNDTILVGTTNTAEIQPLLDSLRQAGLSIKRVQSVRPSLEELFMEALIDPTTGKAALVGAQPPPLPSRK
jgi:ABC-2 type transport system ATP-binding protein